MLRDVICSLDYSSCAEAALVIFAICFVAISLATLMLSRSATDRYAAIPLSDRVEDPRNE
jgi:cytochrome c oxidase cbb3-type subunit IV